MSLWLLEMVTDYYLGHFILSQGAVLFNCCLLSSPPQFFFKCLVWFHQLLFWYYCLMISGKLWWIKLNLLARRLSLLDLMAVTAYFIPALNRVLWMCHLRRSTCDPLRCSCVSSFLETHPMDDLRVTATEYLRYLQKHPITRCQDRMLSKKLVPFVLNGGLQYFFTVLCLLLSTKFQGARLDWSS